MRPDPGSSGSSHTGIDPADEQAIGSRPQGRGILGVLIHEAHAASPARPGPGSAFGRLPDGPPPMRSFLGVPILLRGVAYGNLYLTEKAGGADFSDEDEELVTLLAGQAAVAIENVRLYEAATRWSRAPRVAERGRQRARDRDRARSLLDLIAGGYASCSRRGSSRCSSRAAPTSCVSPRPPARAAKSLVGRDAAPDGIEERPGARRGREANASTPCSTIPRSTRS